MPFGCITLLQQSLSRLHAKDVSARKPQVWFFLPLLLSNRHSIVSILVLGLYTIPAVLFLKLSCSSFTIHLSYFIAQQQACIQIAATIYTQACPRTSLFCFLLYQLSLWWVKYRAQPEAINPWKHASRNAPWQAETSWGEKVKPRKPAWNQAFLWLPILFHTPRPESGAERWRTHSPSYLPWRLPPLLQRNRRQCSSHGSSYWSCWTPAPGFSALSRRWFLLRNISASCIFFDSS